MSDLKGMVRALGTAVSRLDPRSFSDAEAMELVEVFAEGERLCAAGKAFAARRVERSKAWQGQGHRSAAHWMAEQTGVSVGQAVGALETARHLGHLPDTAMALASAELSETTGPEGILRGIRRRRPGGHGRGCRWCRGQSIRAEGHGARPGGSRRPAPGPRARG